MLVFANKFTGRLFCFNATTQDSLEFVDVSNNAFTGPLPPEVFRFSSLQVFSAGSNCLGGEIPLEVCSAHNLTKTMLNAMSTGQSCHNSLFRMLSAYSAGNLRVLLKSLSVYLLCRMYFPVFA